MQIKKTANIFLRVEVFVFDEIFAPILAVKTLVTDTKKTMIKFTYPRE